MILFLDVDGVLHPLIPRKDRPASEAAQLSYLPRLAGVLSQHPDIRIVISSTWRVTRTLDQLRTLFPLSLQHRLIGVTPVLEEARFPGARGTGMAGCPCPWRGVDRSGRLRSLLDESLEVGDLRRRFPG